MQTEELFDLSTWIENEITKTSIIQFYSQVHSLLSQNAQPGAAKAPFETQRDTLIEALRKVPLHDLSIGQLEILNHIGISGKVGKEGAEFVENTLYKNALDIASAVATFQKAITDLNSGVQWASQLNSLLSRIIKEEAIATIKDNVLVRVHFTKDARLENLTDLKEWGRIWYEIGRGIAIANDESPDTIKIVGASKGSVILSLMTTYGIAKIIGKIVFEALKIVDKVFDLRKKAEEIRSMHLANDKAEKSLLEAAELEKNGGIESLIQSITKEYGLNKSGQGDKANELSNSIKKLIEFAEKGGELDFVLPDDEEEEPEVQEEGAAKQPSEKKLLRDMFKEVRYLESKVKMLEGNDC